MTLFIVFVVAVLIVVVTVEPSASYLTSSGPTLVCCLRRGMASVVFALLAYEDLEGATADAVLSAIALTVAISVVAHGATARPGVRWHARRAARRQPPA